MIKKYTPIAATFLFFWMTASVFTVPNGTGIQRLTYSGNNVVEYPCLSDDGLWMLYVLEIKENDTPTKALMLMNLINGKLREIFRNGTKMAPPPYENIPLLLGSKPPLISGNGRVAVFSLTLGEPENRIDHYLGVINTDSDDLRIFSFPIEALNQKDIKSLGFLSRDWERISNYAIDREGCRIACLLKGHLGPRRYGSASGIILLDARDEKQRTLVSPDFNGAEWEWTSFPSRPLLGGGWSFCLSGNGEKLVFGAQSSEDKTDFDLYSAGWDGKEIKRITDFHDRWFSLADISHDGKVVVFSYNGKKIDGMGTYVVNTERSGVKHLESRIAPRIEFFDLSGNGRILLFKHIYRGMALDLQTGRETVAFDQETPGYIKGLIPMDFPRNPAFWGARIMSFTGDRAILIGPPIGKETPEIYLLRMEAK
jgi:hypothetical protein